MDKLYFKINSMWFYLPMSNCSLETINKSTDQILQLKEKKLNFKNGLNKVTVKIEIYSHVNFSK